MPTLLLADDSVTIQRVIELTFAQEGVRVISVSDGETAIARMEIERPDVVLADVGMPRGDGYQVAMHMKRTPALAQVPVVLLAGAFEPIDEARARQTGCDGVLVKPFEPRQLLTQVRALLAGTRPADLWPADMPRIVAAPPSAPPPPAAVPTAPTPTAPPPTAPVHGPRLVPPPPREIEPVSSRSAPSFEDVQEPGPIRSSPPAEAEFELGLDDLDLAFSRLDPVAAPSRLDADTVSDFQRDIRELRNAAPDEAPREREQAAPDVMGRMDWDLPTQPVAREREQDAEPLDFVDVIEPAAPPPAPAPAPIPMPMPAAEPMPPPQVERQPFPVAPTVPPYDPEPAPEPEPQPFPVAPSVAMPPAVLPPSVPPPPLAVPEPAPPVLPTASLASAFSALLAAEQVHPQLRPAAAGTTTLPESAVEEVVKRVLTRMTDDVVRKVVLETAERLIREEIDRIKN